MAKRLPYSCDTAAYIQLDPDLQHIRGLQDPIFGQLLHFNVVRDEMVQILHSSTVRVYVSLSTTLPLDTKKQIAAILHSPEEEIKLEYANVQVNVKL